MADAIREVKNNLKNVLERIYCADFRRHQPQSTRQRPSAFVSKNKLRISHSRAELWRLLHSRRYCYAQTISSQSTARQCASEEVKIVLEISNYTLFCIFQTYLRSATFHTADYLRRARVQTNRGAGKRRISARVNNNLLQSTALNIDIASETNVYLIVGVAGRPLSFQRFILNFEQAYDGEK